MPIRKLQKAIATKNRRINELSDELDSRVLKAQEKLAKQATAKILKGVPMSKATSARIVKDVSSLFSEFNQTEGLQLIKKIIDGTSEINFINKEYYEGITGERASGVAKSIQASVDKSLGVSTEGIPVKNGYLDTLLSSTAAKNKVRNLTLQVVRNGGTKEILEQKLARLIRGNQQQYGALQGYYRNYANDIFATVDARNGQLYAEELGLNFASYEGGLIPTSRIFCRNHNGHVYHRSQIAKWKPAEAIPPNYDPFIDRGGYGCRHFYNWVTDEMAVYLEPSMKRFLK